MFPVKIAADLSNAQLWLLHWLQVYDWAYTLSEKERPSDAVIEDNTRFDVWYKSFVAKRMNEDRSSGSTKSASSHSKTINF